MGGVSAYRRIGAWGRYRLIGAWGRYRHIGAWGRYRRIGAWKDIGVSTPGGSAPGGISAYRRHRRLGWCVGVLAYRRLYLAWDIGVSAPGVGYRRIGAAQKKPPPCRTSGLQCFLGACCTFVSTLGSGNRCSISPCLEQSSAGDAARCEEVTRTPGQSAGKSCVQKPDEQ